MGIRTSSRTYLSGNRTTVVPPISPTPGPPPEVLPVAPMSAKEFVEESLPLLPALVRRATPEQRDRLIEVYRSMLHPEDGCFGEEVFAELMRRNPGLGHAYELQRRANALDRELAPLRDRYEAAGRDRGSAEKTQRYVEAFEAKRRVEQERLQVSFELGFDPATARSHRRMRGLRRTFEDRGTDLELSVLALIGGDGSPESLEVARAAWVANREELAVEVRRRTPQPQPPERKPEPPQEDTYYDD